MVRVNSVRDYRQIRLGGVNMKSTQYIGIVKRKNIFRVLVQKQFNKLFLRDSF